MSGRKPECGVSLQRPRWNGAGRSGGSGRGEDCVILDTGLLRHVHFCTIYSQLDTDVVGGALFSESHSVVPSVAARPECCCREAASRLSPFRSELPLVSARR